MGNPPALVIQSGLGELPGKAVPSSESGALGLQARFSHCLTISPWASHFPLLWTSVIPSAPIRALGQKNSACPSSVSSFRFPGSWGPGRDTVCCRLQSSLHSQQPRGRPLQDPLETRAAINCFSWTVHQLPNSDSSVFLS